jgi:hypothetical protein
MLVVGPSPQDEGRERTEKVVLTPEAAVLKARAKAEVAVQAKGKARDLAFAFSF